MDNVVSLLFLSESQALEQGGEKDPLPPDQILLLPPLFLCGLLWQLNAKILALH
jgi:hypothetical protein